MDKDISSQFTYDFGIRIAQSTVNRLTRLTGAAFSLAGAYYALKKTSEEYLDVAKTNALFFGGQLATLNAMVAAQDRLVKGQILFRPEDQLAGLNKLMSVGLDTNKYFNFLSKSAHALGMEFGSFSSAVSSGIAGNMSSLVSMGFLTERAVKMFEKYPANTIMRQQAIINFLKQHKGLQNAIAQDFERIKDQTLRITGVWKSFAMEIVGRPNDPDSLYSGIRGSLKSVSDALARNLTDMKRYGQGIGIILNWTVKQIGSVVLWLGRQAKKAAHFLFGSSENFVERMRKTVVWLEFWKLKVKDFFSEYGNWIKSGLKILLGWKALKYVFHIGSGAFLSLSKYRLHLLGLLALQRRYASFTGQKGLMTVAAFLPRTLRKAWIMLGKIFWEFKLFFHTATLPLRRFFSVAGKGISAMFAGITSGFRFLGRGFLVFSNMLSNFPALFAASMRAILSKIAPYYTGIAVSMKAMTTKVFSYIVGNAITVEMFFKRIFTGAFTSLSKGFVSINKSITKLFGRFPVLFKNVWNLMGRIPQFFSRSLKNFPQIFSRSVAGFSTTFSRIFSNIPIYFATAVSGFGRMFSSAVSGFKNILHRALSSIPRIRLTFEAKGLKNFLQNMPIYIGGGFKGLGKGIKKFIFAIPNLFKKGFKGSGKWVKGLFKPNDVVRYSTSGAKIIEKTYKGVFSRVMKGFGKNAIAPLRAFKGLMEGIFSVFKVSNPVGWIVTAITTLGVLYLKYKGVRDTINSIALTIWNLNKTIWNSVMWVMLWFRVQIKKLFNFLGSLWDSFIQTKVGSKVKDAFTWVHDTVIKIKDAIVKGLNAIKDFFGWTKKGTKTASDFVVESGKAMAEKAGIKNTFMIPSTDPAKQEARRIERQKRREERKKRREERNNPVEEGFDEENYSNGTVPIPDMIIPEYGDGAGVYPEYEDPYAGGGFEYQTGKKPVKNPIVQTPTENNSTVNEGSNSSSVVLNDGAVKIIVQKGEGIDEKLLAKKVRDILSDIQRSGTMRQGKETLIPEYR